MKCPVCGKKVICVLTDINHPIDILGCDDCVPPEKLNEDIVLVFDTDPEWAEYCEENNIADEEDVDDEEDEEPWEPYAIYEGEE